MGLKGSSRPPPPAELQIAPSYLHRLRSGDVCPTWWLLVRTRNRTNVCGEKVCQQRRGWRSDAASAAAQPRTRTRRFSPYLASRFQTHLPGTGLAAVISPRRCDRLSKPRPRHKPGQASYGCWIKLWDALFLLLIFVILCLLHHHLHLLLLLGRCAGRQGEERQRLLKLPTHRRLPRGCAANHRDAALETRAEHLKAAAMLLPRTTLRLNYALGKVLLKLEL